MANYLSSTEKEDKEMLQAVGVERFSDLYQDIPFELRNKPLNIPNGKSLQEVSDEMQALADKNVLRLHHARSGRIRSLYSLHC